MKSKPDNVVATGQSAGRKEGSPRCAIEVGLWLLKRATSYCFYLQQMVSYLFFRLFWCHFDKNIMVSFLQPKQAEWQRYEFASKNIPCLFVKSALSEFEGRRCIINEGFKLCKPFGRGTAEMLMLRILDVNTNR
ncbi:hypothetical protein Fot_34224 [Forsythia ovata]|uniref:Uncharacterized protein n=1 Tax=Forsythia ovata TaxID=205694 RepID=A0ABD1SI11_9LAMI